MTVPPVPALETDDQGLTQENEERKRRTLLLILLVLLLALCCVGYFVVRYLVKPQPVTDMLPVVNQVYYPPTFKMSFPGVDEPVGIALSPDGQRIYVSESGGERLVKIFDRQGKLIKSFAPSGTNKSNRKPTYIAVDANGRVFVTDSYNGVIDIFDAEGNMLDAIIDRDMTLSKFITAQVKTALPAGATFFYDKVKKQVVYQPLGQATQAFAGPPRIGWTPLGVRFSKNGDLLVTNLVTGEHSILIYPAAIIQAPLDKFNPQIRQFGVEGKEKGQLSFPNSAVTDSNGNFYIADGNNGRVSAWTADLQYRTFFGFGSAESALNLPRGEWMDAKDHLHVVDAVGAVVRVYDVSQAEPTFLYDFGLLGSAPGQFNFPIDICIDASGTVYIADRENNRIDIWSY